MATLYRVAMTGSVVGEPWANVVYIEWPEKNAQAVCEAVRDHWVATVAGYMIPATLYQLITATEVGHLLLDPDYYSLPITTVGSRGGVANHSDPQLAVCFTLRTGLAGRKRRGRIFLAGLTDDWVTDGKYSGTYLNDLASALAAAWTGSSPTAGGKLVVFSRKIFSGLTDIILDSYKPVTTITPHNVLSTMRSRKPVG